MRHKPKEGATDYALIWVGQRGDLAQETQASSANYGEGSGEERPRGKRQPTKKDPTAFRGGGRGRGLLGRLCPKGSADPTSPVVVDGWATA